MRSLYFKEISEFFSTLTGYIVMIIFLLFTGLFIWVFSSTSVFNYNYATLSQLFTIGPIVFMFLIPAITMQSFATESHNKTLEFLLTKPISVSKIVLSKYLAICTLLFIALLPTVIYYFSIYQLGSPVGNIDRGAVIGSYIGLFLLGALFASAGMWVSTLTHNQIASFLISMFVCFILFWSFDFIAELPLFFGKLDYLIRTLGASLHYENINSGRIDTRDLLYFLSLILFFLWLSYVSIKARMI